MNVETYEKLSTLTFYSWGLRPRPECVAFQFKNFVIGPKHKVFQLNFYVGWHINKAKRGIEPLTYKYESYALPIKLFCLGLHQCPIFQREKLECYAFWSDIKPVPSSNFAKQEQGKGDTTESIHLRSSTSTFVRRSSLHVS